MLDEGARIMIAYEYYKRFKCTLIKGYGGKHGTSVSKPPEETQGNRLAGL